MQTFITVLRYAVRAVTLAFAGIFLANIESDIQLGFGLALLAIGILIPGKASAPVTAADWEMHDLRKK
jgi:hypothetical protein